MNHFGSQNGWNLLLDVLTNKQCNDQLTLTAMSYMITMISMPSKLFHRDWIAEYAAKFAQAMIKQLIGSPDKILKDINAGNVGQIQ